MAENAPKGAQNGQNRPKTTPKRPKRAPKPFSVPHFRAWAATLTLDSGEPFHPEPFQEKFLEDVFSGVGVVWFILPEGSGKTTLMAALALYVLEFSPRAAEIPIAAASREQAMILYRQAEGFVLGSEALTEPVHSEMQARKGKLRLFVPRFQPLEGNREVKHYRGGRIKVHAADERTGDGVMFTLAIIDELHRHPHLGLYRTWDGKRAKRGGQLIVISTAGEPGSEFEQTREQIRQQVPVVERRETFIHCRSPQVALHEWAVPEDGDCEDMALVARANPFSRITEASLRDKFEAPGMILPHWRRLTCNRPTRGDWAAITEAEWASALLQVEIPEGAPITLGLDVGWKLDATACVPAWQMTPDLRFLGPASILEPPRDGTSLDPASVEAMLRAYAERYRIERVVMDPTQAEQLAEWIRTELGVEEVVEHQQGNVLRTLIFSRFMEALREGKLKHSGDPGLTRHVLNAVIHELGDGRAVFERPSQSRYGGRNLQNRRAIDALIAAAMANSVMAALGEEAPVLIAWV